MMFWQFPTTQAGKVTQFAMCCGTYDRLDIININARRHCAGGGRNLYSSQGRKQEARNFDANCCSGNVCERCDLVDPNAE